MGVRFFDEPFHADDLSFELDSEYRAYYDNVSEKDLCEWRELLGLVCKKTQINQYINYLTQKDTNESISKCSEYT